MKKSVFLIIALFFVSMTMKSQLHITPEVGLSILKKSDMSATISPRIGVDLDFYFAKDNGFGIGTGLFFYQKKEVYYSGKAFTQSGDEVPFYLDEPMLKGDIHKLEIMYSNVRRSYLQLPILLEYKWKLANNLNLSLAAGPYIAYGIAGNYKGNSHTYDAEEQKVSFVKQEFSPYDLYAYNRFEVGITTKLSLNINQWIIKMNYETNLNKRNLNKDNLISLGVGYMFQLK